MKHAPIGVFRTRMSLESPVDTPDDTGAFARTWTFVAHLWGRVTPQRGEQDFVAGSIETAITHLVAIRTRADVVNGMRFTIGSRALLIRAVFDPDGRGRVLECRCEEFAA
jgi:SPP1 family predicted phage head-tail adaptor